MIVNYKIVGGSSYTLLFNEAAGDANEKFAPSFRDAVQKVPGYGAANQIKVPLSNTDGEVTFNWKSNYSTPDAALAAINTLRGTFKGVQVHLQIIQGATTLYLPNAVLSASSHDPRGIAVMHQLTFATDDITSTAP